MDYAKQDYRDGRLQALEKMGIPNHMLRDVAFTKEPFCRTLVDECSARSVKLPDGRKETRHPVACDPLDEWWLDEMSRRNLKPMEASGGAKGRRERTPYEQFEESCIAKDKETGPVARRAVAGVTTEGPYIEFKGEKLYAKSLYFFPTNEGRYLNSDGSLDYKGDVFPEFLYTMVGTNNQKFHMMSLPPEYTRFSNYAGDIGSNEVMMDDEYNMKYYMQSLGGYTVENIIANTSDDQRGEGFFEDAAENNRGNEEVISLFMDTIRSGVGIQGFNYSLHGILAKPFISGTDNGWIPGPTGEVIYARLDIRDGKVDRVVILESDDAGIQTEMKATKTEFTIINQTDVSKRELYSNSMVMENESGYEVNEDLITCRFGHILDVSDYFFSSEYSIVDFCSIKDIEVAVV